MASLEGYLARIGYSGDRRPSVATLFALHRAHLAAIPYENLDIHLGRRLELDVERIYEKLVGERRGGWCYEMNGVFAWALGELGFRVTMLAAAVGRERIGADAEGNHLALLVDLDRPYLADVGFGDGFLEQGARWIAHNQPHGGALTFDFTLEPRVFPDFAEQCHRLQTSPDSGFVQKTICQRHVDGAIITLRGAVFRTATPTGVRDRIIETGAEFREILRSRFDLDLAAAESLWPSVWAKHLAWTKAAATAGS